MKIMAFEAVVFGKVVAWALWWADEVILLWG